MKTEQQLNDEIAAIKADYHAKAESLTPPQVREINDRLDRLKADLSSLLSAGAKPCPKCEGPAHGMHKNPNTYEVGCRRCRNTRARGPSVESAVKAWNAGRLHVG